MLAKNQMLVTKCIKVADYAYRCDRIYVRRVIGTIYQIGDTPSTSKLRLCNFILATDEFPNSRNINPSSIFSVVTRSGIGKWVIVAQFDLFAFAFFEFGNTDSIRGLAAVTVLPSRLYRTSLWLDPGFSHDPAYDLLPVSGGIQSDVP